MIKFWKEDFKYIKRSSYIDYEVGKGGYLYTFYVRGESANYLMNTYDLDYPIVLVHLFTSDNSMTVTSRIDNIGSKSDVADLEEDDISELLFILQEEVDLDLKNYEDYMSDDFFKRDSRWQ